MKILLDHPLALAANRAEKKKQPWEIVTQPWKVAADTKGRYVPSFCSFLEYASRCYIPVGFAAVNWKNKQRVLLAVAVPATYRQIAAALSVSKATASKIISDMQKAGCKHQEQLLLMPAVNNDLYEILDDELPRSNREVRRNVVKVFGGGGKPERTEDGDVEPDVLHKLNRGSKKADRASEAGPEEPRDSEGGILGTDEDEDEEESQDTGDRIARCREVGESGVRVLF
jgi:hypothetical protein